MAGFILTKEEQGRVSTGFRVSRLLLQDSKTSDTYHYIRVGHYHRERHVFHRELEPHSFRGRLLHRWTQNSAATDCAAPRLAT